LQIKGLVGPLLRRIIKRDGKESKESTKEEKIKTKHPLDFSKGCFV
jgi:hypothetical protein